MDRATGIFVEGMGAAAATSGVLTQLQGRIFALLYLHAYRRRGELGLSPVEVFDTRESIQEALLNVGIGVLSVALAAAGGPRGSILAGWTYALLGPVDGLHGAIMGRRRRALAG